MPFWNVSARSGAATRSARAPGRSSWKSSSLLRRNGRWCGNDLIAWSSAGTPSVIESWMNGLATSSSAVNVVSRFTNKLACDSAAGATMRAASPSSLKKRLSSVRGDARFFATGWMSRSSAGSTPSAVLMLSPRPANASPKPWRFSCIAVRVSSLNMLVNSSNSTGAGRDAESGIVSPSSKPESERPRVISTYLRPSADFGRMITVESFGSGLTSRSSLRPISATLVSFSSRFALIESTAPTRAPPIRTSLPLTRFAALGDSSVSW